MSLCYSLAVIYRTSQAAIGCYPLIGQPPPSAAGQLFCLLVILLLLLLLFRQAGPVQLANCSGSGIGSLTTTGVVFWLFCPGRYHRPPLRGPGRRSKSGGGAKRPPFWGPGRSEDPWLRRRNRDDRHRLLFRVATRGWGQPRVTWYNITYWWVRFGDFAVN